MTYPRNSPMLFALAFDHRSSLRRDFLGLSRPPTGEEEALGRRLKAVVCDGLLTAVEQGLPAGRAGLLVDEHYGADVIDRARGTGIALVVPVEVSGRAVLAFEHGDEGFGPAIERVDPTYVKVLVRHNRDRQQRDRLCRLQAWLTDAGRDWMLELLVPPTEGTARAVAELVDQGLRPTFWKLEGMPSTAAFAAVAEAAGPGAQCLVLGRGADAAAVERWLRAAAPVPAYQGFAVGRTLWWEPLRSLLDGTSSEAAASRAVAANYRRHVDVYLEARRGA